MCPWATQHNVYSCYLMSCLVNVPLSSVRSRRLRCARLCLSDGSAYTIFLRIHTHGSSRQSKLWGEQQHMHPGFNCRETQTNTHTHTHIFSFCLLLLRRLHTNAQGIFTVSSHKPNPRLLRLHAKEGWDLYILQASLSYTLVSWDKSFFVALFLHLHVARHAGRLPL